MWTDRKNQQALKYPPPRKLSSKQGRWMQYFNQFNFTLKYFPGGKNSLTEALSRMSQYNSTKEEVVSSIIPSSQIAAPVPASKAKPDLDDDLTQAMKTALAKDEWFTNHKEEVFLCNGLAWVGSKLCAHQPKAHNFTKKP